jgi:23S rRNA-/tRNA-specific pseudouridylate synthase
MKILEELSKKYLLSKRSIKTYLKLGLITLDNNKIHKDIELLQDDLRRVKLNVPNFNMPKELNYKSFLIKKFENIIFFYKPPFMHTERHKLEDQLTLDDIICNYYPNFHLISRLDYPTDGLIAAIDNSFNIVNQKKHYIALVHGKIYKSITINFAIDYKKRKKVKVQPNPGEYTTQIIPIKNYDNATIIKAIIIKGLRHQIRAHLSYIGHPIYGDIQYGINDKAERLMLSCYYIKINNYVCLSPYLKNFYTLVKELVDK